MVDHKFKIGDKIKVISSVKFPNIIGCIGTIADIDDICDNSSVQVTYSIVGLPGFSVGHWMREDRLELYTTAKKWNLLAGKPNYCIGCNLFNEYQDQAFVCYKCENGI